MNWLTNFKFLIVWQYVYIIITIFNMELNEYTSRDGFHKISKFEFQENYKFLKDHIEECVEVKRKNEGPK